MISLKLKIVLSLGIIVYFIGIIYLLKRKSISLKYTLMWIFAGFTMISFVLCPRILNVITKITGIELPSNAIFVIVLFFILLLLMSLTSIVSKLSEKNKTLVQNVAILEKRIRDLESEEKKYD